MYIVVHETLGSFSTPALLQKAVELSRAVQSLVQEQAVYSQKLY